MQLGAAGTALIQSFEQCRLTAYQDQKAVWTIGWGHTLGVVPYQTCTQADADAWFIQDTHAACIGVMRTIDVQMNQNQFDAMVSLAFNIGAHAFADSTLAKLLNGAQTGAAADQFLLWDRVNGVPNAGLLRRRTAERALFLT
jgi:lysozyme